MRHTSTGNRVLLKLKGEVIGVVQSLSADDNFDLQSVEGIGDVETQEFVVGLLAHNLSGEKYFVSADTLQKLGFVPRGEEWLTAPELEVEVIDTVSGQTIELYTGCKFNSHSRRYTAHRITGESFQIRARHRVSQSA
ncbi:MAG: hypothetical protein AB7I29_10700 [Geobacter sp.]